MILSIDITHKTFMITKEAQPKLDQNGTQRTERLTGEPMWATEMVCTDTEGGTIVKVNTSGKEPDFAVGDPVRPVNLVALPWATNGRGGIAFRADSIEMDEDEL